MGAAVPPDPQTIAAVVAQATRWRRTRYQEDDRYRHFTGAAMAEQVSGDPVAPIALADGWWLVGRVVDVIADMTLDVLVHPGERRMRTREPAPPPERAPPKPKASQARREYLPESERPLRAWLEGEA